MLMSPLSLLDHKPDFEQINQSFSFGLLVMFLHRVFDENCPVLMVNKTQLSLYSMEVRQLPLYLMEEVRHLTLLLLRSFAHFTHKLNTAFAILWLVM